MLSTISVFDYSTEAEFIKEMSATQRASFAVCQTISEDYANNYDDLIRSHISLHCMRSDTQASTNVIKPTWKKLSACYSETTVFNKSGVNAGTSHKDQSLASGNVISMVNIGSGGLSSVLHVGV